MTMLSPHFSAEELTRTHTGLSNRPSANHLAHLYDTARNLEKVRALLDGPLIVTSGYRSPVVNKAVRGVATSAHCLGYAADFDPPPGMSHFEGAKKIAASDVGFDQLILEYGWIHISFDPRLRHQVMTKKSASSPYENGLHK